MTLIYEAPAGADAKTKSRLHALVIGVADYPHLLHGAGPQATYTFQLGQVEHPKPSAIAIAKWLIEEYQNRDVALGSVELLVSPGETWQRADGTTVEVAPATFEEIKSATARWYARCHTNPGNTSFMYFCGHGMTHLTQLLLPQDFGTPEVAIPWERCIDFTRFLAAMRGCAARTQLFFVDACRNQPEPLSALEPFGHPLVFANSNVPPPARLVFYAAAPEQAVPLRKTGGTTALAEAFLKAMRGAAAQKPSKDWRVSLFSLSGPLVQLVSKIAARDKLEQTPDPRPEGSKDVVLHELDIPLVFTEIDCETALARREAAIELVPDMHSTWLKRVSAAGSSRPWFDDVELGNWEVLANFESFAPYQEKVEIGTPFFEWMIER